MLKQISCAQNNTCYSIPLEKRKIIKKSIIGIIPTLTILLTVYYYLMFSSIFFTKGKIEVLSTAFIVFVAAVFSFIINIIYQILYYRGYFYDLTNEQVIIRKGVISRQEISLYYSKIQNVYIDQDVLDRPFGLYDVHLETAGFTSGKATHIDGVNGENAKKLRDMLASNVKTNNLSSQGI